MDIGFNFTLGNTLPMVQRFRDDGLIDYCELLIDNFLQVPPHDLAEALDCPVGFHIMFSRFIEADRAQLRDLASQLRPYIEQLKPRYVSDHVACFSHQGRQLYHLAEIDYPTAYAQVREQVLFWQDQLGMPLYLENYPSILDGGHDAPAFFQQLAEDTGARMLFDASNAVCAWRNCGVPLTDWLLHIDATPHFHVGGYNVSVLEPKLILDTHDSELADDTLAYLRQWRTRFDKPGATLTYERDNNLDEASIARDLRRLRAVFCEEPAPCALTA